ncbi:MAG: hypothetical protein JXA11_11225 [Phycisphaerae bacterium]|nr:hypothetical protein [Phycisphaerae bacterium]
MKPPRRQFTKSSSRRRAAVLVIVLVAITLLVGLLFFVYNLGNQVSRRQDLQNTADAVTTGGAGWMARSMNTIAMNNVGQAKLIATALVLDAIPLAAELALHELKEDPESGDSLGKGLKRQIDRGVPDTRREKGFARSASHAEVVADAILIMPPDEPVFGPLWPGDENSEIPEEDYDHVYKDRIPTVGQSFSPLPPPDRTGNWSACNDSNSVNRSRVGASYATLDPDAKALWATNLKSDDGQFHVYAWWSSETDGVHRYSAATYTITTLGGPVTSVVDQNRNSGAWVYLGTYYFPVTEGMADIRISVQGPPDDPNRDQELTNFLRNGLVKLAREMTPGGDPDDPSQYDELILLDEALNSTDEVIQEPGAYDVTEITHWDVGDGTRGKCWAAALAMRDLSAATAQSAGLLAQANAQQYGRDNHADTSFLAPMRPAIPCKEGKFDDFTPVLTGLFHVRLEEPQAATLTLPIYQNVTWVNNLDLSLDDLMVVYEEIRKNLDDLETVAEDVLGQPDWEDIELQMRTIRRRVENIDMRRLAILQRLPGTPYWSQGFLTVMGELIQGREGLYGTLPKIDQILEEIQGEKDITKINTWLEQVKLRHEDPQTESDLIGRAMLEEEQETNAKETILANLHHSCPGGGIPDYVSEPFFRLGPYATLHKWRFTWWDQPQQPGWGGDPEVGPTWGYERILGYTTYGPYRWCLDEIARSFGMVGMSYFSHAGSLDVSRFTYYTHLGANIKLAYSYGVTHPQKIRYATRWITDYEEARAFAQKPENRRRIIRTRYYRPVVMSSVKWDHDNWLKDKSTYWSHMGAWQTYWNGNGISPPDDPPAALWIWEPWGWYDVSLRRPQAEKLNDYTWRWSRGYGDVVYEHRVGLNERRDAEDGSYIPWNVYLTSWYVFGGIQIADEVVVSNPCNWPEDETDKPRPMLMDFDEGDYVADHDAGVRRSRFTYLGLAGRSGSAPVWPEKFVAGVPGGNHLAVSQAEVFNNCSWDLWTQNWREQLVPVSDWEGWIDTVSAGADDLPKKEECDCGIDFEEAKLENVLQTLQRVSPELVQVFMNH